MPLSTTAIGDLQVFLLIVETGSFTVAAARLNIGKNVVSQKIRKLEKDLGVALFVRTTRTVVPTDEGQALYRECRPLVHQLDLAFGKAGKNPLKGPLRITAPADYSEMILSRALVEFSQAYPDIEISLITHSRIMDLVSENVHLGIRLGWPKDSTLKGVKVGEFDLLVVASAGYLRQHGLMPSHPRELAGLNWIELSILEKGLEWRFTNNERIVEHVQGRSTLGASTAEGVLSLVRSGGGIGVATDFSVAQDIASGRLVRLVPDWQLPRGGIYLIWPHAAQESRRLRACIDFLRHRLAGIPREIGNSADD